MRPGSGSRRGDTGAVAVEFALILPILIALMLGITTAGFSYSKALATTDAVREGARFGATTLTSPPPAGSTSWAAAVQTKTAELSYGGATASQVCVQLVRAGGAVVQSSTCSIGSAAPATPTSLVTPDCAVKVWAEVPVTINIGIQSWDVDVVRGAVARYERTC
ncbi:hypothetical protein BH18ACT8_BH18ACT8_00610 [soil metagenome]